MSVILYIYEGEYDDLLQGRYHQSQQLYRLRKTPMREIVQRTTLSRG
jgi:hypothetical protein